MKLNSPDNDNFDNYNLWILLTGTHASIFRARDRELARNNSSTMQSIYLDIIYKLKNEATIAKVAEYAFRETNTASEYITRMADSGLVKRVSIIKQNQKKVIIKLTAKGLKIYNSVKKSDIINEIFSSLNIKERNQLKTDLKILRGSSLKLLGLQPPVDWPSE
jgi:DNA-binding MarR family transcriptional regulator